MYKKYFITVHGYCSLYFQIIEIENDENVKMLPIESRGCKFPWENEDIVVHQMYSYSSCIVQCRVDNHYRLCNCTHHLMPVLGNFKPHSNII